MYSSCKYAYRRFNSGEEKLLVKNDLIWFTSEQLPDQVNFVCCAMMLILDTSVVIS